MFRRLPQSLSSPWSTREPADGAKLSVNDLPKELLVSIFIAVEDDLWVRRTVPLVCKEWNEIYRSQDMSPLHETLEADFWKDGPTSPEVVARLENSRGLGPVGRAAVWERPRRHFVVHASRVISRAERRAGSVRNLHLEGGIPRGSQRLQVEGLGQARRRRGHGLPEPLRIRGDIYELCQKPFSKNPNAELELW